MCIISVVFKSKLFVRNSLRAMVPILLLMTAFPSFGAELSVQFSQVARSGGTPIPEGVGNFTGFGDVPAIDDSGNVVFTGAGGVDNSGKLQAGAYTFIDGNYQMVADKNTLVPGGGGATFTLFSGAERNDIDDGRIAFTAQISTTELLYGLYSNVGQADPNDLVEVILVNGDEWGSKGDPYVDDGVVSVRGRQLIPQDLTTILQWDGWNSSSSFVDPGAGYIVTAGTQASISGDAVMFRRYKTGFSEMGISIGEIYETLAVLGSTSVPGLGGSKFQYFRDFPVVDRNGLDAAFIGSDGTVQGVFKRTDGGALESVANTLTVIPGTTPIPGWGDQIFTLFPETGLSLANGKLVFLGNGMNSLEGIYTDIGGNLSVIVDDDENRSIELGGQTEQITRLGFGPKSFVYTPQGYMIVFKAWFESGETAIIRATITIVDDGSPGVSDGSPPMVDFENGNADGWLLNGNVAIDGILAIGQFSLRHGKSATSVLNVSTAGYDGVSVTMHLAATSLKKGDTCYAEVSTNGGDSWLPVIELQAPNDDGTFYSGTVSPPDADDNWSLQLRFRASGKGKKGYCYGDDVIVSGTPIGN